MRLGSRFLVLMVLVLAPARGFAPAADPQLQANDEQALKAIGLGPTGPEVLEFFRKRCQDKINREQVAALIRQLGDKTPALRNQAIADLVSLGNAAVPFLRRTANELDDPEIAGRAKQCLQAIEGHSGATLSAAAVRALAALRPPGSAEALVAYLPVAEDDHVLEEVTASLTVLAVRQGKPEPALLKAMEDPIPIRRATAAEVLCQVGGEANRGLVRKLLQDPKPTVRLRVALALARGQDPEAVPVLIGLFANLPSGQARPIEEYLADLAGEWAISVPAGNDAISRRLKRDLWLAWWNTTGGPDLLEEFKKRTLPDPERTRIQALVQKLGENAAATREKALADLLALGTPAIPFLRQAVNDRDARAADQAQKCLQLLDQNTIPALPMVAVRLLALRRPVGAAEAVLGFLPSAEDETIAQELRGALAALVIRDGKVDPAYLKALEDKEPIRRAGAAEALCQAAPEFRPTLRKLLQDPDPVVRWRVALALGTTGEKEALPVLIALLTELPSALADQAESSLRLVAGENSPDVTLGEDEAGRKKARAAWEAWWKKNGDKADLARLDSRSQFLGFTLVVEQYDPARRTGRVLELDRRGKTRWQIEGLMAPSDAQVLPGDRVLVCEQNSSRVSERDLKGKVVWERQLNQPVVAQRLANGNTFLVGRGQISEVDRNGKEIYNHPRPAFDIICGKKLRNGHITYVTNQGLCVRMDASGKELKTIRVPPIQVYNGYVDMLANDHVLVPLYGNNRVAEFDAEGKIVWEATITLPMSARRLANGNTLVTSVNPSRVVELDRNGKAIWENKEPIRQPTRADRR